MIQKCCFAWCIAERQNVLFDRCMCVSLVTLQTFEVNWISERESGNVR